MPSMEKRNGVQLRFDIAGGRGDFSGRMEAASGLPMDGHKRVISSFLCCKSTSYLVR